MGSKSRSSSNQQTSTTQADNRVEGGDGITIGAGADGVVAEEGGIAVRSDGTVEITNFDQATIESLITASKDVAGSALDFSADLGGEAFVSVRHAVDALRTGTEEALDAVTESQATALGFGKSIVDEGYDLVESVQLEALGFAKAANDDALSIIKDNTETALDAARNADASISEFAITATLAAVVLVVVLTSNPGLFA